MTGRDARLRRAARVLGLAAAALGLVAVVGSVVRDQGLSVAGLAGVAVGLAVWATVRRPA